MRNLRIVLTLVLALGLVACGLDNTMYNAKNYFKSAQGRALNANGRPTPQAVDEYTKAIQKCGIILSRNSKGKRADDALFLMARALYYKKNSAFQAKDAFENLIAGYPNSNHLPDAYIYLARVLREVNQPERSEAVLELFIRDSKYQKHHARALLVLADFEIADKDYIRAQFWLERILRDYRKADEFPNAFFLFGKNYYMQKDYAKSLEEFQTFVGTRGIPKESKLEARYYIALNQFELGDQPDALREIRYVIRNEIRPDMLSRARVLYGRTLLAGGEEEDGLAELEAVTKTYPRSEHAAAAYYYWGRYLYYQKGDRDTAITQLNRVRTELSASEYAPLGQQLATAISQTKTAAPANIRRDLQAFLDFHYQRAESFLGAIALPDSALTSFNRVIAEGSAMQAEMDSLRIRIDVSRSELDSLSLLLPDFPDSTGAFPESETDKEETSSADSLDSTLPPSESLIVPADSVFALADRLETEIPVSTAYIDSLSEEQDEVLGIEPKLDLPDSLSITPDDAYTLADTLNVPAKPEELAQDLLPKTDLSTIQDSLAIAGGDKAETDSLAIMEDRARLLQQTITHLEAELDKLREPQERFISEIIPFCKYSIFSILHAMPERADEAGAVYEELLRDYPRNIYTAAVTAILAGRTPNLVDPEQEEAETAFDLALDFYPDAPDSLVTAMQDFLTSEFEHLRERASYRLGWFYTFEAPDTSLAREYLDAVLLDAGDSEYAQVVRRFYDGRDFLLRDTDFSYITESAEEDSVSGEIPLEEGTPAVADSLQDVPAGLELQPEILPDSLEHQPETPVETDSLDVQGVIPAKSDTTDIAVEPDTSSSPTAEPAQSEEAEPNLPESPPLDSLPPREEKPDTQ